MAAVAALSGCGGSPQPPVATPLRAAPEPAVSPPAAASLPGAVVALAGAPEGVAVTDGGTVAVNVRQGVSPGVRTLETLAGLVVFPIASSGAPAARHSVPLTGSARHLTLGGPDGPALVAEESDDLFVRVALPSGQVLGSVHVGRQPHEAFRLGPDSYVVADELGNTFHLVRNGRVVRIVPAPLQPGGGAASPDGRYFVGVGVRGRRITEYRASGDVVGSANCGAGPTHVVSGSDGLFWVNDTNGDAVLGFTLTAHGPRQVATVPTGAGSKPYGIAYDARRHTLWVTLTGRDQLLGLTFGGTRVTHRATYATVQQPNTVAVDATTGELVVTGSIDAGNLQFLRAP
ncbi:MAG: hypothetical protein ACRDXE_02570 [Acidimicrobiales bacterium]